MSLALLLLAASEALAVGVSADVELLRPTLAKDALPGVDSPVLEEPGTVRVGGMVQQLVDPLLLYEEGREVGAVIKNRTTLHTAVAWDFAPWAGLRATLPVAVQYGTDRPEASRDGAAFGDIMAGARLRLLRRDFLELGLKADVGLPSGTRRAWMGEAGFRGTFGMTALGRVGPVDLLSETTYVGRPLIPTPYDFTLGNELMFGLGARYHVWRDRASVSAVWAGRGGLGSFGQAGAENPSELLAVTQLMPRPDVQVDLGVGKGLAPGYGTAAFRAFVGLTWVVRPKPEEPPPPLVIPEVPPPDKPIEIPPDPEPEWEEEELARIEGERIVIRDPIEFEFNTRNILPQSLPTLRYVAELMNENWQIGHLVIEGHASEEGSFIYNYDLSLRRATAIWEELIRSGVHPDRMSIRGMGEVVPRSEGDDEASLADNRRVEFKIVRQYRADEEPEELREGVRLPWNGTEAEVGTPEKPEQKPKRPPPPTEGTELEDFFDEMDDPEADPPDDLDAEEVPR